VGARIDEDFLSLSVLRRLQASSARDSTVGVASMYRWQIAIADMKRALATFFFSLASTTSEWDVCLISSQDN